MGGDLWGPEEVGGVRRPLPALPYVITSGLGPWGRAGASLWSEGADRGRHAVAENGVACNFRGTSPIHPPFAVGRFYMPQLAAAGRGWRCEEGKKINSHTAICRSVAVRTFPNI